MTLRTAIASILVTAGLCLVSLGASAEEPSDAPPPPPPVKPLAEPSAPPESAPPPVTVAPTFSKEEAETEPRKASPRQRFSAGIGFRAGVVNNAGFDPYSMDNSLPMATIFGTFTPWDTRPLSLHLAFEWDYGGSTATARGAPSELVMHRLALGLEARYMPITRMRLFVRGMPSAIHVAGLLKDPAFDHHLETGSWTWGVDVTGGAAARIGSVGPNDNPSISFWAGVDMGYRFAGATSMRYGPAGLTDADKSRRFGEVQLTDLDLSGFISRLAFSMAF